MDSATVADVLLETVEASADPYPQPAGAGTPRDHAVATGLSRKGYWRLSKTLATHTGMDKQWFLRLGLVNLRYAWSKLAPLRRTA